MNRLKQGRLGSPVMRGALTCALAVALIFPTACASASSTPSSSPRAVAPTSAEATPTVQARVRKPITVNVRRQLFGIHDATMSSLTRPGVGAIRLWDAGVMWSDIEPTEGDFHWDRLDQYVEAAHAQHTEVTLVLAGTPAWAVDPNFASSPVSLWDVPSRAAYRSYVTAVMSRYKAFDPDGAGGAAPYRGIANYQVWNEPNIRTFWTGTPEQMAGLTQVVSQVRAKVDKGAKVIAPSMVLRLTYEMKAAARFYRLKVSGRPIWKYVDATAFSLYPVDQINGRPAGPEDSMTLVRGIRAALAKDKVPASKPMWNAEVNYGYRTGGAGGTPAVPISDEQQAAYVLRTYILNAAQGLSRVFWYRYDLTAITANTHMVELASPSTMSLAGDAFYRVQKWLKGGTLVGTPTARPCAKDRHGTYTCVIRYDRTHVGRVYWNPTKSVKKTTVKSTRSWESGLGAHHTVKHKVTLKVNYLPTLVRSRS